MDNIVVRLMTADDIDQVVEIEEEAFASPWTRKGFEESLTYDYSRFYVATIDNEVVGYIGTYCMFEDVDITNVAVRQSFRRKGIANKLLEAVISYSIEKQFGYINLEVRPSNVPARKLYEKYSFGEIGIRKNFYTKPVEDGIIMQKDLSK